jgi:hypothetical protein
VRRVVVVPATPRVVRVVTPAPAPVRTAKPAGVAVSKPAPRSKAKPAPEPAPKPVVRISGERREAIVRAVAAGTADPLPLFLAAAALAGVALAGGSFALAVGRELRVL